MVTPLKAFSGAVVAMVLCSGWITNSVAADRSFHFEIADQTLSQALRTFGQVSGQEIIFTEDLVASVAHTSLKGDYTAADALRRLLAGTGLMAVRSPSGAVMIKRMQLSSAKDQTELFIVAPGSISVPSTTLKDALAAIADQSGVPIRVDPDAVAGLRSQPVSAAPTAFDAVYRALLGTNLAIRKNEDGGLTVFNSSAADALDTVVVTATRDKAETSYYVDAATTSNRSGGTLHDLPQATSIITGQLIADQQAQSVVEAIQNSSSTTVLGTGGQGLPTFQLRGYPVSPLTNGLSVGSGALGGAVEPIATVERIEVLEGPAAILAGQGNQGGTINIVSKKPSAEPLLNVSGELASYADRKLTIDGSDALTSDKTFSGRIILEQANAHRSFGGYEGREESVVAPSLRYKTAGIDAIIGYEWSRTKLPTSPFTILNTDTGAPYVRGDGPFGPRDQGIIATSRRFYYDLTKDVTPWMTFVSRAQYTDLALDFTYFSPGGFDPPPEEGGLGAPYFDAFQSASIQTSKTFTSDSYARFNFTWVGIKNTLTVGINTTHTTVYDQESNTFNTYGLGGTQPAFNFFDTSGNFPSLTPDFYDNYNETAREAGEYIQDLIEYKKLHILAAGRFDQESVSLNFFNPEFQSLTKAKSNNPSVGLVYDLTSDVAVYANYLKGFVPNYAIDFSGKAIPDDHTVNKEVGIKFDSWNKRLNIILSLFDLKQSNVLAGDPIHPGFVIPVGGQESKGAEASITGQIMQGLNVKASYTHAHFKELDPTDFFDTVAGEASDKYTLYVTYRQSDGLFKGLGGGFGVFGSSSSHADSYASFIDGAGNPYVPSTPGGAQVNGNIFYSVGHVSLNVGVKNLFDKRLYSAADFPTYVPLAPTRNFVGTLIYSFL